MQIQIRDSSEFHSLLLALVDELVDAHIHFRLFKSLNADIPEYVRVFNQSCAFWQLTLRAHLDAVFLRLCKAYDQYGGGNPSLNLRNLLDTVAANLYLFDEPNFRERLRDNPFVDSLAATSRRPDLAQLQQDLLSVSSSDPLVNKLTIWRNNFYAHRSPAQILDAEVFDLLVKSADGRLKLRDLAVGGGRRLAHACVPRDPDRLELVAKRDQVACRDQVVHEA